MSDRDRLIAQLRQIERSPGDLWEREVASRAREEIETANAILDSARERLYWLVVEQAGPKPVPIERLMRLVEERITRAERALTQKPLAAGVCNPKE